MRLALVPLVHRADATGLVARVPDLPSGVAWAQATSESPDDRQVICLLDADDATADAIAARSPRHEVRARHASPGEVAAARSAFLGRRSPPARARADYLDLMRGDGAPDIERAAARRRILAAAVDVARRVGLALFAALVMQGLIRLPHGISLALVLVASDGFSGSGGLSGRTMDAAGGGSADTWAMQTGSGTVSGGSLALDSGAIAYDSTRADEGPQRSEFVWSGTNNGGPAIRIQTGTGALYFHYTQGHLYKWNGGFTLLASSWGTPAAGHLLGIEATGSAIDTLYDGIVKSSASDSTYATGRIGVYSYDGPTIDDWAAYADAGGSVTPHHLTLLGVGG